MAEDSSGTVTLSLIRLGDRFVPTIEGNVRLTATPISFGTPEAPLEEAFGEGYRAFAEASLTGGHFDIQPNGPARQSLDRTTIDWTWSLRPERAGDNQQLTIILEAVFEPEGDGDVITDRIWSETLAVDVTTPWFVLGQLSLLSLATGLLGTGLSIPWLYDRAKEWFGKRAKKKTSL